MNSPPINHDNGPLRNEVSLVPIVLGCIMVCAEFIDWSPSQRFLDDLTEVVEIGFIVEGWGAGGADDAIEFGLGFFDDGRVGQHADDTVVHCQGCRF